MLFDIRISEKEAAFYLDDAYVELTHGQKYFLRIHILISISLRCRVNDMI